MTAPHTAWLNGGHGQTRVYSQNVNLRVVVGAAEGDSFHEPWVERFHSSQPRRAPLQLWFVSTCVFACNLVGIDDFRVYLPMPDADSMRPDPFELRLAEIYAARMEGGVEMLYQYIERAGYRLP